MLLLGRALGGREEGRLVRCLPVPFRRERFFWSFLPARVCISSALQL